MHGTRRSLPTRNGTPVPSRDVTLPETHKGLIVPRYEHRGESTAVPEYADGNKCFRGRWKEGRPPFAPRQTIAAQDAGCIEERTHQQGRPAA